MDLQLLLATPSILREHPKTADRRLLQCCVWSFRESQTPLPGPVLDSWPLCVLCESSNTYFVRSR